MGLSLISVFFRLLSRYLYQEKTAGTSCLRDEERRRGSGAVHGPLARSVELAQSTSDFGVEAGAGPFQGEEIVAEMSVTEVAGRKLVDRFVQPLDRRIHTLILYEHTFDFNV